jgi:hypothetical protein
MATLPSQGANFTLNKFGVPLITNGNVGAGILMPKLKYRFSVLATNFGSNTKQQNFTQQCISCGRPDLNFNRTELHSYNNVMYIPQKPQWSTIDIVFRDDLQGNINTLVGQQVQKQMNFFTMSSGVAGLNYKFQLNVLTLDGTNVNGQTAASALEAWYLEGCYIQDVKYDSFDYSSSEPVVITLTVSFDNATQSYNPESLGEGTADGDPGDLATGLNGGTTVLAG